MKILLSKLHIAFYTLILLQASGFIGREKQITGIEGFYSGRCLSSRCQKCLSIFIRKDSTFFWRNWSPCESEEISGSYKIRKGKHCDTLILHSCSRVVKDRRRAIENTQRTEITNFTEFENKRWLIKNNKLFFIENDKGGFHKAYLPLKTKLKTPATD